MNGDLKQTFVLHAVQEYIKSVEDTLALLIRRKKIGVTDDLVKSIRGKAATVGQGVTGELIFKEYGRMVDMGAGRGHPLGGLTSTKIALKSNHTKGLALIKSKARKPKKFYSPTIYGKLTYLQNKLLFGYSEEAIANLKLMQNAS